MARVALLIGSTQYQQGFQPLPAVAENVQRLASVLGNPEIGGFEVETLLDPDHGQMRIKLETWLRQRQKDDVSLLYLTGHGVKDRERKLHFAATDTSKPYEELITSTALAAADLRSYLRQSKASKQVVILDCCFSGAFGDLVAMDDGSVDVEAALLEQNSEPERPGRVVLTSSSSMQYSFVEEGAELSLYTQYLLEGLETGAASTSNNDAITADEVHRYVSRKVTEVASSMTPKIFVLKDEGYHIRIAKVPVGDPKVRYRKELEAIVQDDDGEISFINRECLQLLAEELIPFGFTTDQAIAIEKEVLEPIRQRRAKEQKYGDIFAKAIQQQYPLRERELKALARLQKRLALQKEDYQRIETALITEQNLRPSPPPNEAQAPKPTAAPARQTKPPAAAPKPLGIEAISLKTQHADYHKLRDLLQAQQWREADQETYRLMITTVGKKDGDWFSDDDLKNFPCEDLRILDQLWVKHSEGKFGFSVQKRIWEECGSPSSYNDDWKRFGDRVGWRSKGSWLSYDALPLDSTGELPFGGGVVELGGGVVLGVGRKGEVKVGVMWGYIRLVGVLFSRAKTCRL